MRLHNLHLDRPEIGTALRKAGVVRAWVSGSILTDGFTPISDIDLLIETDAKAPAGLMVLGGLQMDLSELLGRTVHLTLLRAVPQPIQAELLQQAKQLNAA
jgi:predicted nucleotidyltransferase